MEIKTEEITSLLREQLDSFKVDLDVAEVGEVIMVGDGVARVGDAPSGSPTWWVEMAVGNPWVDRQSGYAGTRIPYISQPVADPA